MLEVRVVALMRETKTKGLDVAGEQEE